MYSSYKLTEEFEDLSRNNGSCSVGHSHIVYILSNV